MSNPRYPWRTFWVLLSASIAAMIGVLPYVFSIFGKQLDVENLTMPVPVFAAVQVMHSSIVFALAIVLGLLLAPKVGLRMPVLESWLYLGTPLPPGTFRVPLLVGLGVGAATVILLFGAFLPRISGWPSEAALPIWMRFLACVYGGIIEEVLMRLFLLSLVLWLLQKISRKAAPVGSALFWTANIVVAFVFGAAYLPAAARLIELTPMAVSAILFLKGTAGLIFGYLCRVRGLEAAMLAHFAADFMLHVIAPMLVDVPVAT